MGAMLWYLFQGAIILGVMYVYLANELVTGRYAGFGALIIGVICAGLASAILHGILNLIIPGRRERVGEWPSPPNPMEVFNPKNRLSAGREPDRINDGTRARRK